MPKEKHTKKAGKKRATWEEITKRHRDIGSLLDKGYRVSEITYAISQQYDITMRQAERDVKAVKEQRGQFLLLNESQALRAEQYHKLDYIYRDSLQKGDRQTALKAITLQANLVNDNSIRGGEQNAPVQAASKVVPEELEALLAELETDRLGQ